MEILDFENAVRISRVSFDPEATRDVVSGIKKDVLLRGDETLRALTSRFDGVEVEDFLVTKEEIDEAYESVSKEDIEVLETAASRIREVNEAILTGRNDVEFKGNGYQFNLVSRPIENVGLYVPGGLAFYPSTVLMLGIPAKVAGCGRVIFCTPPNGRDNGIPPITLAAAKIAGVDEVYQVGGAQAVFAMAYGTDSIQPVDKIFGPGNKYVTSAKMMLGDKCGVDAFAGPSEILILADKTADSELVKADLLSQLEHGPDSPCVLVTSSRTLAEEVKDLDANGFIVLVESVEKGIEFANRYRAEHTEVITANSRTDAMKIQGGAVFIGAGSSVPMGDYGVSGSNHVIPTSGATRFQSPVSVEDFMVRTEYTEVTDPNCAAYVPRFAELEGLPAHAKSISLRISNLKKS